MELRREEPCILEDLPEFGRRLLRDDHDAMIFRELCKELGIAGFELRREFVGDPAAAFHEDGRPAALCGEEDFLLRVTWTP